MYRKLVVILLVILISSCKAKPIFYSAKPLDNLNAAVKIIEQILYEQHEKYRPESVFISEDFIALSKGTQTKSKSSVAAFSNNQNLMLGLGSNKSLTKEMSQRIYFNSLGTPQLYSKKNHYVAQIRDVDGKELLNVHTSSAAKAKTFINALMYFITINQRD